MRMERLTADDRLMLWGDEIWPQEIAVLAVLDGRRLYEPDRRFRIDAVRQSVEARLHLIPRFRQLLHVPPRGLGPPLWVDAPAFDLHQHVRVVRLPDGSDESALVAAAERLRRDRLDRSRPLWQMCLLPGLPDHRVGLFVKLHHTIADGIAAVATLGTFLDTTPETAAVPAPPWTPAPAPTAGQLFADNLHRHAGRLGHAFATLARPAATVRRVRPAWTGIRHLLATAPSAATSLNRVVGPDRNLALIRARLGQVRRIAQAHHATVNDVLLAVTAGGLRALLRSRGEPVDERTVPVSVPVTLRRPQHRDRARGNLIGQMLVPLPVGVADAGRRLALITAETTIRKAERRPSMGTVLGSRLARRVVLKVLSRRPVNVTSANVPGPQQPVYLAGARLLEVFPVLPLIAHVCLGVGALSYAGQFTITATADADAYPDLAVFVAGVRDDLQALTAALDHAADPQLAPASAS
jgi:WS/DGAT/MGAT family acyltransferase